MVSIFSGDNECCFGVPIVCLSNGSIDLVISRVVARCIQTDTLSERGKVMAEIDTDAADSEEMAKAGILFDLYLC